MWRAKSSTSSSSTRSFSSSSCAEALDREQRLAQLVNLLRGEASELGQTSRGGQQIAQARDGLRRSWRRRSGARWRAGRFVAHCWSAGFFHRSVASGVSAGGGGGRRVSVVVACLRVADEILGLDLDRRLADADGHGDRELSVGADGGGLQAAGRAHGHDRRRRRAALDLGVLAVAIDASARRRSGTPPRRCVRDRPGGAPAWLADAVPGGHRDRLAAGGEARRPGDGRDRDAAVLVGEHDEAGRARRWWCGCRAR